MYFTSRHWFIALVDRWLISTSAPHGTLNPQPSTLHPPPSTLHPPPSTLNPQPSTLN
ncbi:hypothetical protein T484DRAFT_1633302, partial [Baffinella frigidus]